MPDGHRVSFFCVVRWRPGEGSDHGPNKLFVDLVGARRAVSIFRRERFLPLPPPTGTFFSRRQICLLGRIRDCRHNTRPKKEYGRTGVAGR